MHFYLTLQTEYAYTLIPKACSNSYDDKSGGLCDVGLSEVCNHCLQIILRIMKKIPIFL